MRVAQKFAGYTLEEADNLRKACGKKIRAADPGRAREVRGRLRRPRATRSSSAPQLFDIIEPFADYAFNKSHSYGYGLVAYQTAWLKAHYPGRVPGRPAHLGQGRQGQDRRLPRRVPGARHRGRWSPTSTASARRVHARQRAEGDGRPAHRLRPGRGAQRRRGPGRAHRGRARGRTAPSPTSTTSAGGSTPMVLNKRTIESLDQGGGLRLARPPPPGSVPRLRGDRRPDPRAPPRAARPASPRCSRPSRASSGPAASAGGRWVRRHPGPDPRHRVRQDPAAGLREGDARAST